MSAEDRRLEDGRLSIDLGIESEPPLGEIQDLDRGELHTDTMEFEPIKRRRPRRGRKKIVISLIIILLFAGAWFVLAGGLMDKKTDGVPLIMAAEGPIKVRPENPGGIDIPNRDKLVYKRLQSAPPGAQSENLLPKTEAPLPVPAGKSVVEPNQPVAPVIPPEAKDQKPEKLIASGEAEAPPAPAPAPPPA
ncbi:MAG: hypothetical protein HQ503_10570, partial [Rhodospirillales bacterium]|nr:hypothetical protein [Rhodospirillales bacterium]